MNVLDKAEKALEFLKVNEGTAKSHELQSAAGTLGRCLGALGSRPSYARHYANLLQSSIPTLLFLASNDSAEVRLVGDEALNRAVVGGFAFHSHKTNILLQNQIDYTKNERWIRAALSRICLGESWLRPGVGKIRSQAQTLFPKLSLIVTQTKAVQLIVEALENNLPRILNALAEYTTDEEIAELSKALLSHVETTEPAVRRGIANCVAHLCSHRETLLTNLLADIFEKLWPLTTENTVVLGWFCVIKAIFQINDITKFIENDLFRVQDYLELYHLCVNYIEHTSDHNAQNCVMECLTTLLSSAPTLYARALLDKHPKRICLDQREEPGNISGPTVSPSRFAPRGTVGRESELSFSGALQLGSQLQLATHSYSCEDLTIQTPDSPESETELDLNTEQLSKDLTEKLQEYEETEQNDYDEVDQPPPHDGLKINIGSSLDDDIPLKFCARLLASKYVLTGNKGGLISDRSIRVSVKASALNCLSEILRLYPQVMTLYLDKDADVKNHNISGSTENTDTNQENINDFILERNVCYQDSLTESASQDLLKSVDSQLTGSQKKDKLEKSIESEQKSSNKDVQSAILDSKVYARSDLIVSVMSQDTNMTNSNFTTNSNMTGSNDPTTGYPMSSSGDVLSSSIDLDMKFDHFGESTTNLDIPKQVKKQPKAEPAKYEEVDNDVEMKSVDSKEDREFEIQHLSDVFTLLEGHPDPQIRGLVRVCVGNFLASALDLSHGDYNRWRSLSSLPKDVSDSISIEKLVQLVLKGLSDEIHSTVNHTLSSLTILSPALSNSIHWALLIDTLNALVNVESNGYWLCKVNLCRLYEKIPYQKLFMLYPDYHRRSKRIMDTLIRFLADQDQKIRIAASQTITSIIPIIFPSRRETPTTMLTQTARQRTKLLIFDDGVPSLNLVREIYFYSDLPQQMKCGSKLEYNDSLRVVLSDLVAKLMSSNCKYYSQGLLETLQAITLKWSPWQHIEAYSDQGILSFCLDSLDYCNGTVVCRTVLLDLCRMVYPVEIHNIMRHRTANRDIFERDTQPTNKWQHLENDRVASLAEKFLQVTLKMLNVLVHLIEEVNPNVHLNKSGIALPGSPVRRKTQDPIPMRKGSTPTESLDDKGSLRKKPVPPATSLKANFIGHFYNEPFYMKFYESLRAVYSNHKINLDPKSSIFHSFLTTVLNSLAIQLELATEKELGNVTEEILYYLKVIMPLCADLSVYCVTQLLKCLFGTNMISQYNDFMSIADKTDQRQSPSFFDDIMKVNPIKVVEQESRRSSISSNASQRLSMDFRNPKMAAERQLLIAMENFAKNKSDRKWSTNKKELERYIRLFEPVVIQSLKSYTMQNDIPLQCQVLNLLNQLLTLRVNYCMLDSDQIFIGFLLKQLDLVEQHEIPNCCDLVNSILMFLVQLSSSKHHTKQIIEIPKLIQLCDGLMASGAHAECTAGLEPVAVKVFSNMGGSSVLGRAQQQEAQATREVLFYMLQKTMHQEKVLNLVSCVLSLSQEQPESYYRWSELASDTILSLLAARSVELETVGCAAALERLLQCICSDALSDQPRVEMLIRILFQAPPETSAPFKLKLRYLTSIMVLLRKYVVLIPESEILLTINYIKATCISPQSIFFNVKTDVDPLNVQNVNENCANLSPDVILVRFLFKTLTFALGEVEGCYEDANLDLIDGCDKAQSCRLMYAVCVNIVVHVKHMLHLTDGCVFPLTSKTAQSLLHNEQSGLNTGLYNPLENIPLDTLNMICLKAARRAPCLTLHWSHLLIRLNFLSHKYWQKLVGFARNLPLSADSGDTKLLTVDLLQAACVMAYCEYFVDNGLAEAVHLTWLLVNRIHILILHLREAMVQKLVTMVQERSGAAGLVLQAVAARCQPCLKEEFALNTYKILSQCHENQSGALVFFICRIIGKLEPAIAIRFAKLATERCKMLKDMPVDKINTQLSKEDVQVALELLQRDKVHARYSSLVMELNSLASSVFDLSPLDLSQDRAINPQYIVTTNVDGTWLLNQVKSRCCISECTAPKVSKHNELAQLLSNLSRDDLTTVMTCPEFDRKLLCTCFKVACDNYLKEFINIVAVYESKEIEKDMIREQQREMKMREEMTSSIDSNKLNVVNSLHVFKKSDSKESKSQFFIPISDNENLKSFGNLQISDEETELHPPELSDLYQMSAVTFDKSLTDVIRLFPKQNRPLSQSENFSLNVEQTIDRYTRRCHQVFQAKLFYQEFMTIQTIMTGFLDSLDRIIGTLDETDCELLDKCMENILPTSLARNIAIFSVISLQYLSFLIKNKSIVESPVHADVSFRVTVNVTDNVIIDNVIELTVDNVSKALSFDEIWSELNVDNNSNRSQSAISCLYAIVKYLVKDTQPLILHNYIQMSDNGPKSEMAIVGDKLVTLLQYWEQNLYVKQRIGSMRCVRQLEKLTVSLSRLDIISNIALIPPIAWSSVDMTSKKDFQKIDLPLQALQDLDVLEAFLFRVNLIGWSSKKQFEEMWVGLLGALQGNGTHWAVRGITQLLLSAAPAVRRRGLLHVPRTTHVRANTMQRLRNLLMGTLAYHLFDDVNLERVPLMNDGFDGYHCAQFNAEYLKMAADISDCGSFRIKRELKRIKRNKEIDLNSCLQILMDVTTQMLDPKAETGVAARVALVSLIGSVGCALSSAAQWSWAGGALAALTAAVHAPLAQYACAGRALLAALVTALAVIHPSQAIQELSSAHQKLIKSLSSSYSPLRQAALQGCLLQLTGARHSGPYQDLVTHLNLAVRQHLTGNTKISLYEQSIYWTVLFTLVELGHPDLVTLAVDFLLKNPRHYCTDLVVKGITTTLRQQILPKDLKNSLIERLLDNMKGYSEHHAVQILMVHLFSVDDKLLSPRLTSDVSNMDPDILMSSMERITLLYKVLKQTQNRESKVILTSALKYFLRETLPPAATLSRVVIEFVECCKEAERVNWGAVSERESKVECSVLNAEIVFEVFETSITQDQLPVLSGWIFEALCHLLNGKVSPSLLPYTLLTLLVSASSNTHIRQMAPLCYYILKLGFHKCRNTDDNLKVLDDQDGVNMSFKDRRLLCIVALKSNFSRSQLDRLRELCEGDEGLKDLAQCLAV